MIQEPFCLIRIRNIYSIGDVVTYFQEAVLYFHSQMCILVTELKIHGELLNVFL